METRNNRKMETAPKPDVYHLTTPNGNLYFIVEDGVVTSQGMRTDVPFDRFIDFIHTAELLGFKIGKI
jgi:hypothetical protein